MKHWLNIRHDLYRQIRHQVEAMLGKKSVHFAAYQAEYEKNFEKRWKVSSKAQLVEQLIRSRLIFLADFHALQQSQKTHLRVLKAIAVGTKTGILAMECFQTKDQDLLDQFLAGDLSEEDFLKKIQWQETWGFPWEHYRPLLRWAQKHRWLVVGIDDRGVKTRSLKKRDAVAARHISKLVQHHSHSPVVVIFGDLHMAPKNLPAETQLRTLLKSDEVTIVYQNSERIYFSLLKKNIEISVDVVQLSKNQYCLMNVPPWVKWQNYFLFLEKKYDFELSEDEGELDFTDEVVRYLDLLCKDLDVEVPKDHFSIFTAESKSFWNQFESAIKKGEMTSAEALYFQGLIEANVSFYLPQMKMAYLAQASVNHAAVVAAAILQAEYSRTERYPSRLPQDFVSLIWLEAVLYFGSKVINPKRKTDTLQDLKNSLAVKGVEAQTGVQRETLQLALQQKMKEIFFLSQGKKVREMLRPQKKTSYREAARLLGGMLGEKLFYAYRKDLISKNTLRSLLSKRLDQDGFKNVYFEILEMVESLPEPFLSKREKF